jgi:hypothetical protein
MTIIRLALALGVAAVATNQYMKNRRKAQSAGSGGQAFDEDMSSRDDTPLDGAANRAAVEGTTAAGSDSPNHGQHAGKRRSAARQRPGWLGRHPARPARPDPGRLSRDPSTLYK